MTRRADQSDERAPGESRRAAALPPGERRAAIVASVVPLLLERGPAVTTREIAEAAGIAEGTIFRAFPDKDAVVKAAVEAAFDPGPTERKLAAIDRGLPFEGQLAAAVAILQRRLSDVWRLMSATGEPPGRPPDSPALAALFAAHRDAIRVDPVAAARRLRALTIAVSHPLLVTDAPLPPDETVSLLLDGIRARPSTATDPTGAGVAETAGAGPC